MRGFEQKYGMCDNCAKLTYCNKKLGIYDVYCVDFVPMTLEIPCTIGEDDTVSPELILRDPLRRDWKHENRPICFFCSHYTVDKKWCSFHNVKKFTSETCDDYSE